MSKKHYIIPVFISHSGCPHQCVFCNQDKIARALIKEVTKEEVRETIEVHLKTIDKKDSLIEVSFFGGTFTALNKQKQKDYLKVAKEYKDKSLIHKIRMSTRPDAIDEEILTYLKEFTVDIIELGVQSLDDTVLKLSGRGHTAEDVYKASKLIKEFNITLGHQIMPGLPGSNKDKDIKTAMDSIKMKPDICRIYPSLVIKETPMEQMFYRGLYTPYSVEEAVDVSKEVYKIYKKENINIIRVGLQPTDTITLGKDVVAGPFHPAFRELVEGSIMVDYISSETEEYENLLIEINPKDISKLYSNKKLYFNNFLKNRSGKTTVIQSNKIKRGCLNLKVIKRELSLTII